MSIKHLFLIAGVATLGCAPTSTSTSTPTTARARNASVLTAAEIHAANADAGTVYDAVARLRPNWLSSRGPSSFGATGSGFAVVFIDGQQHGDIPSLRNIEAYQVENVSYYDVTQAGAKFGLRGGNSGVIEVKMRVR